MHTFTLDIPTPRIAQLAGILNAELFDQKMEWSSTSGLAKRMVLIYLWAIDGQTVTAAELSNMTGMSKGSIENALRGLKLSEIIIGQPTQKGRHSGLSYTIDHSRLRRPTTTTTTPLNTESD